MESKRKGIRRILLSLLGICMLSLVMAGPMGENSGVARASASFYTDQTLQNTGSSAYSSQTKYLQEALIILGYLPSGYDDGIYGSVTEKAVREFQADYGRKVDGIAGPKTLGSIISVTADIQTWLKKLGYYSGPIDSICGSQTVTGLKKFQKAYGLSQTGKADSSTLKALKNAATGSSTSTKSSSSSSGSSTSTKSSSSSTGSSSSSTKSDSSSSGNSAATKSSSSSTGSTSSSAKTATSSTSSWLTKVSAIYQSNDISKIYYHVNGKIKTAYVCYSGCGPTSLAMAVNTLTGSKLTAAQVFQKIADMGGYYGQGVAQWSLVKYAQNAGLKTERFNGAANGGSTSDLTSRLKKGQLVIAITRYVNSSTSGDFLTSNATGHYILLCGYRVYNGEEQVYVMNPQKINGTSHNGWYSLKKLENTVKTKSNGYLFSYFSIYK